MRYKTSIIVGALFLAVFLSYGNALFNTFVWDDKVFIVENPFIRDAKFIPDLFTKRLSELSSWGRGFDSYYRPVFLLSFMLDYRLWGLNPFFFHLHNVFLHFLATVLVFYFFRRLSKDDLFAFCSSLLFALHPIHTEAVTAVFNRMDIFVTCLVLGAFLCFARFLQAKEKFYRYLFSLFLFGVALFAKEVALMALILFFFYDYFWGKRSFRRIWREHWLYYVGFFAVVFFYLSLRARVLGAFVAGYLNEPMYTSFMKTEFPFLPAYITFQSLFVYLSKLIAPLNFNVVYYFVIERFWNPAVIITISTAIGSFYLIWRYRKNNPHISFLFLWFFITLFPVLHIIPFGNIVAEHYTYLPSIGFCGLLGWVFVSLYRKTSSGFLKRAVLLIFTVLNFFYLYQTILRNYDWRTEFTLWNASAKQKPFSPKPYINLANALVGLGRDKEAEEQYVKALLIQPFEGSALSSLGALYVRNGQSEKGLNLMLMAVQNSPDDSLVYRNLGRTYNLMKKYDDAIRYLRVAKSLNKGRLELYYDLGLVYINKKEYEQAISEFKEAISLDENFAWGYYGIGLAHFRAGQQEKSEPFFDKALILDPRLEEALENLLKEKGV